MTKILDKKSCPKLRQCREISCKFNKMVKKVVKFKQMAGKAATTEKIGAKMVKIEKIIRKIYKVNTMAEKLDNIKKNWRKNSLSLKK